MPDTSTLTPDQEARALDLARHERFARLVEHLGANGPDSSVPGCSQAENLLHPQKWARYALLVEDDRQWLLSCDDLTAIQEVTEDQIAAGGRAIAYYDLDELEGPEPEIGPDDMVELDGEWWLVEEATSDGLVTELALVTDNDTRHRSARPEEVKVVKRWEDDTRLPKRYRLAGYRVVAFFDTVPS